MILQQIRQRAAANSQHIVLPEGEDARTLQAAEICVRDRIARITLIGDEEKIRESARAVNCNLNGVEILDHRKSNDFGRTSFHANGCVVNSNKFRHREHRAIREFSALCSLCLKIADQI